jgi:hypothetical protein
VNEDLQRHITCHQCIVIARCCGKLSIEWSDEIGTCSCSPCVEPCANNLSVAPVSFRTQLVISKHNRILLVAVSEPTHPERYKCIPHTSLLQYDSNRQHSQPYRLFAIQNTQGRRIRQCNTRQHKTRHTVLLIASNW